MPRCRGTPKESVPIAAEQWTRMQRGECVHYGIIKNQLTYGRFNATLPALNCNASSPPGRPTIDQSAGVACPASGAPARGGRRLGLQPRMFEDFEVFFRNDSARAYQPFDKRGIKRSNGTTGHVARTVPPDQFSQFGIDISSGPAVSGVKLVMSIMTGTKTCDYRNLHRATWMTHARVCDVARHGDPECGIFPMFGFANVSRESLERTSDILILDVEPARQVFGSHRAWFGTASKSKDMWLEGNLKTLAWFTHALHAYPWATHVGKMDLDTYPYINNLYNDLVMLPQKGLYYGKWCGKDDGLMLGELYIVTRDVLECWVGTEIGTRSTRKWSWEYDGEDKVFAQVIRLGCPTIWAALLPFFPERWKHYLQTGNKVC